MEGCVGSVTHFGLVVVFKPFVYMLWVNENLTGGQWGKARSGSMWIGMWSLLGGGLAFFPVLG